MIQKNTYALRFLTYLLEARVHWNGYILNEPRVYIRNGIVAGLLASYHFREAEKLVYNVGSFRIAHFGNKVFLDNLEKALKNDKKLTMDILLGPAIYVKGRNRLFSIFSNFRKQINLYYREEFDKEYKLDERHFRILFKKGGDRALMLETPHTEKDPDENKSVCMMYGKATKEEGSEGYKLVNEFYKEYESFIKKNDIVSEDIETILKKADVLSLREEDRRKSEEVEIYKERFMGLITSDDGSNTRSARFKDIGELVKS